MPTRSTPPRSWNGRPPSPSGCSGMSRQAVASGSTRTTACLGRRSRGRCTACALSPYPCRAISSHRNSPMSSMTPASTASSRMTRRRLRNCPVHGEKRTAALSVCSAGRGSWRPRRSARCHPAPARSPTPPAAPVTPRGCVCRPRPSTPSQHRLRRCCAHSASTVTSACCRCPRCSMNS